MYGVGTVTYVITHPGVYYVIVIVCIMGVSECNVIVWTRNLCIVVASVYVSVHGTWGFTIILTIIAGVSCTV